jgi:hypothetical protein
MLSQLATYHALTFNKNGKTSLKKILSIADEFWIYVYPTK